MGSQIDASGNYYPYCYGSTTGCLWGNQSEDDCQEADTYIQKFKGSDRTCADICKDKDWSWIQEACKYRITGIPK
jgi:hypothetical protein